MRYVESAEKVILSEPVIKDVCKPCNEGVLSTLDAYGSKLFDEYFLHAPTPGAPTKFAYDFNRLSRWLLKISFNSARASNCEDVEVLRRYVPDIVNGTAPNITVCLELIEPAVVETTTDSGIALVQLLNPQTLRISRLNHADGHSPRMHILRLVAIQAYWFVLVVPTADTHPTEGQLAEQRFIVYTLADISVLSPYGNVITLTTLGNDTVQMFEDHFRGKEELYDDAIKQIRAKRNDV